MSADEEMIYEFCTELHQNQSVSDATYARVLAKFGEQGIIDLIGVNGYYTFLAMVLNGTRTAVPKTTAPPLPAVFQQLDGYSDPSPQRKRVQDCRKPSLRR